MPSPVNWSSPVNWAHPLNRGLAGWWLVRPNGRGGSVFRDMTKSNDLSLSGQDEAVTWESRGARRSGWGSVNFDGTAGYFEKNPATIDISDNRFDPHSMSAWAMTRAGDDARKSILVLSEISGARRIALDLLNGEFSVTGNAGNALVNSDTRPDLGRWYHITHVWDGDDSRIYVDGRLEGTSGFGTFSFGFFDIASIGRNIAASPDYWNGHVDDCRIWRRGLSPSEVQCLYQCSLLGHRGLLNRPGVQVSAPVAVASTPYTYGASWW